MVKNKWMNQIIIIKNLQWKIESMNYELLRFFDGFRSKLYTIKKVIDPKQFVFSIKDNTDE